jgi:hypothetical protein
MPFLSPSNWENNLAEPLAVGHPLIHLGYAYEFDNREIAMEALGLAATQYNFLHKYLDDPAYTRKAPFSSTSTRELIDKLAADDRFDGLFKEPGFANIEPLFQKHESLVLEYWNAWDLDGSREKSPAELFRESQEAAVALLVATVRPGTHAYNFFIVHVLTTSHAVRILLPLLPARFHVSLVRQWWLLALAVYIAELRPRIDPDYVPGDLKGKGWKYVEHQALNSEWATDAHYVKGEYPGPIFFSAFLFFHFLFFIFCGRSNSSRSTPLLTSDSYSGDERGGTDVGRCP